MDHALPEGADGGSEVLDEGLQRSESARRAGHPDRAVTDRLKGMTEALSGVFPATTLQTCIVHLIRNSLDYASWSQTSGTTSSKFLCRGGHVGEGQYWHWVPTRRGLCSCSRDPHGSRVRET